MPELPDVAGFKKYLDSTSLHQRIERTKCFDDRFIKNVSLVKLQKNLKDAEMDSSRQWGKWLFVKLTTGGYLALHFGMTGQLHYGNDDGELPDHARLVLYFENGYRLAVISQRLFGEASFTESPDAMARSQGLGPDALDVGKRQFVEILSRRSGAIKSTLMNQSVVAGIGNVYSDEILFQARVHPETKTDRLDTPTLRRMHTVMRRVLKTAARKGGDGLKAPKSWLLGKRGADQKCPKCGGELESEKVGGRTAWFCPTCQKKR